MEDRRLLNYTPFQERLDEEMRLSQKELGKIRLFFQEPRHVEEIRGTMEDDENEGAIWRKHGKDRMKTVGVAIIMCLHIGIDPPDVPARTSPCARKLAWVDPHHCGPAKAAQKVALALQKSYERWQPRAKYRIACDPPIDDVRKIATTLRRVSGHDRILFHYNGHGVPKPTDNGEIWVFNKTFTQYIPLSIYDLQTWIEFPAVYVWECNSAETIINSFQRFANDHIVSWQNRFDRWQEEEATLPAITSEMNQQKQAEMLGYPEKFPKFQNCIHLASCRVGQSLPMSDPRMPADLFTSCLTTPVHTAVLWYLLKTGRRDEFPENELELIPGQLAERRTILGELNWIFTAITDTIAFTSISRELFQKLFRQDLLLASLFRSFLLAQRVMSEYDVLPVSYPALKNMSEHELWACWDSTLDMVLDYVRETMYIKKTGTIIMSGRQVLHQSISFPFLNLIDVSNYVNVNDSCSNWFFVEQLQAFELWLDYGIDKGTPPLQLPVVLQVLLSQAHRVRALKLLARFLDFGRWAVGYSLSVGIFPYVLRLLQSNTREMRKSLAFIWAKILAVDPSCQIELFKENGEDSSAATPSPQQGRMSQDGTQAYSFRNGSTAQLDDYQRMQQPQIGGRFQTIQNQMQSFHQYARQQQMSQQGQNMLTTNRINSTAAASGQKKKEGPLRYLYFVHILNNETSPKQKIVPAFVLAMLTHNNYRKAQENLTENGFVNLCTELLCDPIPSKCRMLKLWLLIGLGRLWSDYDPARWQAVRLMAYDKVVKELEDNGPEVRAAAVFALGSLLKNASQTNEHASAIDEELADELCNRCVFDGSALVREELIVALQWFVFDFEKRFVKLLLELIKICNFRIPQHSEINEDDEEGFDIASRMKSSRVKIESVDFTQPSMHRKKVSTSVFSTAVEEEVLNDVDGKIHAVGYDVGRIEREPEDIEYRNRAKAQIRHLESKTFNEPIARTWLALLRLSLDPIENVARMAQKIVKRVEAGTHEMEASMKDKLTKLNQRHAVRKLSKPGLFGAGVMQPTYSGGIGSQRSKKVPEMAQLIHDNLLREKNDEEMKKLVKERVKFQVGSPAQDINLPNQSVITPLTSPTNTSKSSENSKQQRYGMDIDDVQIDSSKSESLVEQKELAAIMSKSFTPKRRTIGKGDFVINEDSKTSTLRKVIENPIVSTQFVQWCSRIFVEPISHLLSDDSKDDQITDTSVVTVTNPTDWAIHAMEGMRQSADIEEANYTTKQYDHCLWKVNLTHSVKCLVTSKLRRCIYASDGKTITIIRQDTESRSFRRFEVTDNNPFNQDPASQLILINELSREMLMACSPNGIVRIWDPFFTAWSDEYENPPQLVSVGFPLENQMKLSDESNRCLFDWNQPTGCLYCTGPKSLRVWDAHCEKTIKDIHYPTGINASGPSGGKYDKNSMPTAMAGHIDEECLVALGYADGNIDVFDLRLPRLKAMRITSNPTGSLEIYEKTSPAIQTLYLRRKQDQALLFSANSENITKWELRMFREPSSQIRTANESSNEKTLFYVHNEARIMSVANESSVLIYDVASAQQTSLISPPLQSVELETMTNQRKPQRTNSSFGFLRTSSSSDNQRKLSLQQRGSAAQISKMGGVVPKVTALTMHQMRLMTVAGYDDNTVCVYGSTKPGLTGFYDNSKHIN